MGKILIGVVLMLIGMSACVSTLGDKGDEAVGGMAIAALFGLGGIAVTLAGIKGYFSKSSASADTGRRCPFCAEAIQAAAVLCRHCGKDLPPKATP